MSFNQQQAKDIAGKIAITEDEQSLIVPFSQICSFLAEFPNELSWRTSKTQSQKPSVEQEEGLQLLANRYFEAYRRSDFPAEPNTIPDEMVSVIMQTAYGYTPEECERIKREHQRAMCAENCVGNLLERYIDSQL